MAGISLANATVSSLRAGATALNTQQNQSSARETVHTHETFLKEKRRKMHGCIYQLRSASAEKVSLNLNSWTFSKLTIKTVFKVLQFLAFLPCNSQHILILKFKSLQFPDNVVRQNNEATRSPPPQLCWLCRTVIFCNHRYLRLLRPSLQCLGWYLISNEFFPNTFAPYETQWSPYVGFTILLPRIMLRINPPDFCCPSDKGDMLSESSLNAGRATSNLL